MLDNAKPVVIGVVGIVRSRTRRSFGYFEEVLQGIISEAGNRDADVHVYRDDSWLWSRERPPFQDGVSTGLILFSPSCRPEVINVIAAAGLPAVSVGENVIASGIPSVDVDNYGASKAATEHLIKLGHRRIAILTGRLTGENWARMRFAGYVDALQHAGLAVDETLVGDVTLPTFDYGYEATCVVWANASTAPPTAIVALNDEVALGAITRIKEIGLRVPGDVSIIGFDDVPAAERADTPLSTMRQPTASIGVKAVDMVIKSIQNRHMEATQITVPAELIQRSSTAEAPTILRNIKAA